MMYCVIFDCSSYNMYPLLSMCSPEGQQFVSSKDVSAHLFSSFGVQDATHGTSCLANESSQLACRRASENVSNFCLHRLG